MNTSTDYSALLSVDTDAVTEAPLKKLYTEKIVDMKQKHLTATHIDSGFDLFVPSTTIIPSGKIALIDMKVKCAVYQGSQLKPSPYYLYPRSSVSKRGIMLANSVGIIDSGYRGNLMAAFYNTNNQPITIQAGDRIVQICMPALSTSYSYHLVQELEKTERGEGGLGSTGN
tara:strand:- start:4164 stop:4676 length:513 start_codon:yes stop_codon:yes gene_type:complete